MRRLWKILIALVVVLAVVIALNTIAVNNDTKPARVTIPGAEIVSVPGADLQVKQDGPADGPAIVLLHGYTGSIHWWDRITPLLARNNRVIRIDLLGHGGSQKPSNGYSMDNQAQLVAKTLAQLGVANAIVVGHSMGATVATALTQRSPQLVAGLTIVDEGPANSYVHEPFKQRASRWPVLGQTLWRITPDSQVRDGLGIAFAKGFSPVPDQFVHDLRGMTFTSFRNSARDKRAFLDRQSLDSRLKPTGVPLLVIFGAGDRLEDPAGAQVYRDVPGAEIDVVAGAGHSPQVEKPAETARLIENFAAPIFAGQRAAAKQAEQKRLAAKRAAARKARQKRHLAARKKARSKRAAAKRRHGKR
jgi:pimeloyl-ACP methyl ester carboxylesterase